MPIPSLIVANFPRRWRGLWRLSSISSELMIHGSKWRTAPRRWRQPLGENTYRAAIGGGLIRTLGFSSHLPENRAARVCALHDGSQQRASRQLRSLGTILKRQFRLFALLTLLEDGCEFFHIQSLACFEPAAIF